MENENKAALAVVKNDDNVKPIVKLQEVHVFGYPKYNFEGDVEKNVPQKIKNVVGYQVNGDLIAIHMEKKSILIPMTQITRVEIINKA